MTARNFFDGQSLQGVELEDEGGSGTVDSHLDARVYKADLMAGIDGLFMSTIDLAIMEDLGVYKANYSNSRPISFGKDMGCNFLTQNCYSVAGGLGKYWCNPAVVGSANGCTTDYRAYGGCTSTPELTDTCSFYLNSARRCYELQSGLSNTTGNGESFSENSRCFMTSNSFKLTNDATSVTANSPRCFDIKCEVNGSLYFRVGNQTTWNECVNASQNVTVAYYDGVVTCPSDLVDVCRTLNETGDLNDVPSVTLWTIYPKPTSGVEKMVFSMMMTVCLMIFILTLLL
jgi:leishmanolysin-like peptidase